ncbi:MAG: hypothetical protein KC417_16335, partial [Myxococcales bacterium]|nr:hypothetical protein [Myxococcales bacterium]
MGYGDLVEVFDGLTPQQASEVNWVNFIQSAGWPVPLKQETFYQGAKASAYKYTDYPGLVGGIDGLERRADVPYTSLQVDPSLAQQGITATLMDANGRPAVPFMFCSDETADLNPDCLRYDAGPDAYESIQSVMDSYYNYYIFSAYGRGRIGFSPGSYFNRVMGRYFGKIQSATQIYGLYRGVFEDFLSFADTSEFWTSPNGMGAWTTMVGASYQLLTQVVATPEPGAYALVTRPDGSQGYELNDFGQTAAVRVDNFEGRPLETTWDFDAGYFWFDQVDRAGFFFDKVGAIMTLVDPTTHFVGRDTSADVRKYALSYYTVFPGAMTSFLRAMQGEDWSTMAARSKEAGGLSFPDVLSQERRDTAGIPIDPNTSFSIQLYAQVFSLALIPDTYDQRFTNGARVYVKGSPNGVDLAAGTPTVEFTDAETGLVYVAASYMQDGKETGVGAQMIDHANALKVRGQTAELRKFVANLDLAHRLGWYFSFGG